MKSIVLMAMSCVVLSAWCLTPQEKAQYKRMSAKYTAEPVKFVDHTLKSATLLVKCHPSDVSSKMCEKGKNQPFGCLVEEGAVKFMFTGYVQKSSSVCKELMRLHSSRGEDVACYVLLEKPLEEQIEIDGETITAIGCSIKEFMTKEKYEEAEKWVQMRSAASLDVSKSVSIAMFKADKSATPVKYFAKAKLNDYYNYNFDECEKTHWSVSLACRDANGNKGDFYGYAAKQGGVGESVKKILEDGREHEVEVVLSHPRNARSGDHCEILFFALAEKWEKKDAETAKAGRKMRSPSAD